MANLSDVTGNNTGTNTGDEVAASDSVAGIAELATIAETDTGTDATRAVTPAGLAGSQNQTDTDANTAKVSADGLVTTHSDVTDAGSGIIISAAERTAIGTNTTNNAGSATVHSDIDAGDITNLGNLSGTNTGDQSFDDVSPMTTGGDLIYGGASGTGTRLANGAAGEVLTSNGTTVAPSWEVASGGQTLYDVIVDAAGGGDYTSIKTAYDTEAAGTTIYVRNGAYSESVHTTLKQGTKLIGESRDGVVLTCTASSWGVFRSDFGAYRGGSERNSTNTGWNTTNMGTCSVTNDSADVVYTGTTHPAADDLVHIAPNFYALIDSVDTGTKTITMDRTWGGDTRSGLDLMVHDTTITDTAARTEVSNMTVIINTAGQVGLYRVFNSAYNVHMSDIKVFFTDASTNTTALNCQASMNCSFNDIEIDCNSISQVKPFLIYNGISEVHCNNIIAYNVDDNAVQFQGGTRGIRRSTLHFKSLSCLNSALTSQSGVYQCDIRFDYVQCDRLANGTGVNVFQESRIEVRKASVNSAFSVFEGTKSIFAFNYINLGVSVGNVTNTDPNIITDSFIDGTLTADTELVVSGSVCYDVLSGSPAQNNGYLF